ncbi:unnamed protein product [Linum tenue]|uniref:Uncharacterized protein n=1 Tax=Linum tenue TaxID=586396 RepID=A0AAV0QDL5_9ROSI|nr:unnamed protein product [Linum tenue]
MDVKRSWTCTLVTQLCLCVALYLALNIGEPQQQQPWQRLPRRPDDVIVFVTVRGGGFRPFQTQTHLLKQIEDVVRIYGARFVVNFSELGEEDPLTRKSALQITQHSLVQLVSWADCCTLTLWRLLMKFVIDLLMQDLLLTESMNGSGDGQNWLGSTLEAANGSIWSIVVGYHPIIRCDKNHEHLESINSAPEILHHIFVKYGVNAYLSTNACSNHTSRDGVDYIGIAGPDEHSDGPFLPNRKLGLDQQQQNGMADGFLLHRVTSLEMITYSTSSEGKVLSRFVTQQKGKAGI